MIMENEYFIFDHGTYATMWSVEQTNFSADKLRNDHIWIYAVDPEGEKVYAVRREIFNTEEQAHDAVVSQVVLTAEYGDDVKIHHMTER